MVSTKKNYIPLTKFIDISDVGALLSEVEHLSGGVFTATEVSCLKSITSITFVAGLNVSRPSHVWRLMQQSTEIVLFK